MSFVNFLVFFVFYICCFAIVNIPVIYVCYFASYVMRKQVNCHPLSSIYDPYGGKVRRLFVYGTKFQADSSIRSKVIMGSQIFEIGSRDPGHAHLWVVLWSVRSRGSVLYEWM